MWLGSDDYFKSSFYVSLKLNKEAILFVFCSYYCFNF